jgi:hypothetical protein
LSCSVPVQGRAAEAKSSQCSLFGREAAVFTNGADEQSK